MIGVLFYLFFILFHENLIVDYFMINRSDSFFDLHNNK